MQAVAVRCRAPDGSGAAEVCVEVYLGPGLPGLSIVGLVETAIKESRDRVRAAIQNNGYELPNRRILVSLAPANQPKSGSCYDLPIAIGILCASRQVSDAALDGCEFFGELALSGELRSVTGALAMAKGAVDVGRKVIVPLLNQAEAGLLQSNDVLVAANLREVGDFLNGDCQLSAAQSVETECAAGGPDLAEVVGQSRARRALEICAAGGHHLLMSGSPGTGKSMLAQRLPGILPLNTQAQALETASLYSLQGIERSQWPGWRQPAFRAPHHTATAMALAGGGGKPRPGEISLAHHGVLFLDELPEFKRNVLEVLREPLETGVISVARALYNCHFPARFLLIAAMNPCPCGNQGDPKLECLCTPDQVRRYRSRLSGPLLDRFDLQVELGREKSSLQQYAPGEASATVRQRVKKARDKATERDTSCNAQLSNESLRQWCWPDAAGLELLDTAMDRFRLSRRAAGQVLKVARTIADLDDRAAVRSGDVAEALSLRVLKPA